MKKTRITHRIAAFITLACMLAFMLPAAAIAAVEPIKKVQLKVAGDIAGLTPQDYSRIITIGSDNIAYSTGDTPDSMVIFAQELENGSETEKLTQTDPFVAGKTYRLSMYFVATEGWTLMEKPEVTINGEALDPDYVAVSPSLPETLLVVCVDMKFSNPGEGKNTTVELTINDRSYSVNGAQKTADTAPIIMNARTFVPFRLTAEALGAKVEWDGDKRTVTTVYNGHTIVMTIDQKTYTIDGEAKAMDVAPFINSDNRTMVPLRFVTEGIGCTVTPHYASDGTTSGVTVTN